MSSELSRENEKYIDRIIQEGNYQDRAEVLDEAVELLKERRELLEHVDLGTKQLKNGDFSEYDNESLRELFDEIQARGRERFEASKNQE